jgi:hypothetical protein
MLVNLPKYYRPTVIVDGEVYKTTRVEANHADNIQLPLEYFLTESLSESFVLASPITAPQNNTEYLANRFITLENATGFVAGDIIEIREGIKFFQSFIASVTNNVIKSDIPCYYSFTTAAHVTRANGNLKTNGSVTPKFFELRLPLGLVFDCTNISFTIISSGAADDCKFGDLAALTNGLVFGVKKGQFNSYYTPVLIRQNCDFRLSAHEVIYTARSLPAGSYGTNIKKYLTGDEFYGVAMRLGNKSIEAKNTTFFVLVQDDLSSLIGMRCKLQGHLVSDVIQ